MQSIHGTIYLIVGISISMVSYFIVQSGKNFVFFFWLGLLMAFYGVGKLIFLFLRTQAEPKKKKEVKAEICPLCQRKVHPGFRFCPFCGHQLKN